MSRPSHLAENLRRARLARGWSQSEACARGDLSLAGYRDLESGRAGPRAATLQRIADAFEVPLAELLRPVRVSRHVRFRSAKLMKRRAHVLADVARRLDDRDELDAALLSSLAAEYRLRIAPWIAVDRVTETMVSDPREAARETRRVFGLDDRSPVHDVVGLLERRGIRVVALSIESDAFSGLAIAEPDAPPAVVVNTWNRRPVEAWIASTARELGHLVLHPNSFDVEQADPDEREAREAVSFASEFLMPTAGFLAEWSTAAGLPLLDRVLAVKRVFRVSWRMVVARAAGSTEQSRATLFRRVHEEHDRAHGRGLLSSAELSSLDRELPSLLARRPEPAALDEHDFRDEQRWLLVRRALEAEAISLSRGAEILGIPLVEMRRLSASWIE